MACRAACTQVRNLVAVQCGPQHAAVAVQSICVVCCRFCMQQAGLCLSYSASSVIT